MSIDEQINNAKLHVANAEQSLADAQAALFSLLCDKAGVHLRDRARHLKTKEVIEINNIEFIDDSTRPWLSGYLVKKDETLGSVRRHFYSDWELVT